MQIMLKGKGFIILPVVLGMGDIEQESNNEEFKTINGTPLNLKGGKSLRTFSITSFLPSKSYEFATGSIFTLPLYLRFFEDNKNEVIRVIAIAKNGVLFNIQARYKFKYNVTDRAGDIPYTLELMEYNDPKKKRGVLYDYL